MCVFPIINQSYVTYKQNKLRSQSFGWPSQSIMEFLLLKAYSLHFWLHTAEWWCLPTAVTLDLALKEGHETFTSPLWQRNLVQRRQGVRPDASHPAWRSLSTERGRKMALKVEFAFQLCRERKVLHTELHIAVGSPGLQSDLVFHNA